MSSQTGSEMQASGFGSPPPGGGGFGPPPGGGGGGFGPPPGGGGFGPPPGSPPPGGGFGPPPGGAPPGGGFGPPPGGQPPYGAPPPAPKKSNTGLYVGIGCLVVVFLMCLCGGGVYLFVIRPAQTAAEEASEAFRNYQPPPGSFGTVPTSDPSGSGAPVVAAPAGSDTCAKVDRCCPAFYVARGLASDQATTTCNQMAAARAQAMGGMLETVCTAQLSAFTQAGGGVPLPPECQ